MTDNTDQQESEQDAPDEAAPARAPRLKLSSAAVVRGGARGAGAALAAAVALTLITAATVATAPMARIDAPVVTVNPIPAAEERLCAGPVLRLGGTSGSQATVPTSAGRPVIVSAARPGQVARTPLGSTDNEAGIAPDRLTLPPQGSASDDEPQLSGSQSETVAAGTFAGFAASDCVESTGDTWLSAGSNAIGRTSLISISNPSSVDASVDLSIWGPAGEISAPGSTGIILPPGSQRVYPLSGFAPGITSTVVRVQSRGGPIVASMHESIVRTLAAGGVDIAGPAARPATTVTIPGVVISGADAVTAASASVGFDDLGTVIRLLNAGDGAANASVTLTRATSADIGAGPDTDTVPVPATPDTALPGAELPGGGGTTSFTVTLESGVVQDLPVQGLVDGTYTVKIVATAPVTASARISTITAEGVADLAWVASAEALGETSLVAVAPGPNPRLALANPTDEKMSVRVDDGGGERTVDVGPEASVVLAVVSGARLELTGTEGLVAAVSYSGPGALASFTVSVPAANSTPVRVYR